MALPGRGNYRSSLPHFQSQRFESCRVQGSRAVRQAFEVVDRGEKSGRPAYYRPWSPHRRRANCRAHSGSGGKARTTRDDDPLQYRRNGNGIPASATSYCRCDRIDSGACQQGVDGVSPPRPDQNQRSYPDNQRPGRFSADLPYAISDGRGRRRSIGGRHGTLLRVGKCPVTPPKTHSLDRLRPQAPATIRLLSCSSAMRRWFWPAGSASSSWSTRKACALTGRNIRGARFRAHMHRHDRSCLSAYARVRRYLLALAWLRVVEQILRDHAIGPEQILQEKVWSTARYSACARMVGYCLRRHVGGALSRFGDRSTMALLALTRRPKDRVSTLVLPRKRTRRRSRPSQHKSASRTFAPHRHVAAPPTKRARIPHSRLAERGAAA